MAWRTMAAGAVLVTASVCALSGRWPWRRVDPTPAPASLGAPAPPTAEFLEVHDTLRRGETLAALFARHGLGRDEVAGLAGVLDLRRLQAGLVFLVRKAPHDSTAREVVVRAGPERRVRLLQVADGWTASSEAIAWQPEVLRAEGTIDRSLYEALDLSIADAVLGGPERMRLAWDIADVFAWQVDFTRDIQAGDRFRLVLERLVSEEGEVRFGRLLAAELRLSGRRLTAFRYTHGESSGFYDLTGRSLRRTFLRAPVEFRRVSSSFSRRRLHPVLGVFRRHQGTDYAAPPGTPVLAAADGVVASAGWAGGYGNLVELTHGNGIVTRYGHLKRFGSVVQRGARVLQGQVIGFVGSTGLASGPHLHYEFRVDGEARDPLAMPLGEGEPLEESQRPAFLAERDRLAAILEGSVPPTPPAASSAGTALAAPAAAPTP